MARRALAGTRIFFAQDGVLDVVELPDELLGLLEGQARNDAGSSAIAERATQ